TRSPQTYCDERLLNYYVDDLIDQQSGTVGTRTAERKRLKAPLYQSNSPESIAWNSVLLNAFGLEGYLTYAMTAPFNFYKGEDYKSVEHEDYEYVGRHLFVTDEAAYRLRAYN